MPDQSTDLARARPTALGVARSTVAADHVPMTELIDLLLEVFDLLLQALHAAQEAVDVLGRLLRELVIQPLREPTIFACLENGIQVICQYMQPY